MPQVEYLEGFYFPFLIHDERPYVHRSSLKVLSINNIETKQVVIPVANIKMNLIKMISNILFDKKATRNMAILQIKDGINGFVNSCAL